MPNTQDKEKVAQWWSNASENLFISNGERKARFDAFCVTLDLSVPLHQEVNKMLESHRARNKEFHKVLTGKNTKEQQKQMATLIRGMLNPANEGGIDDVAKTSGKMQLAALFTDEELEQLDVKRSVPDVDVLSVEAINTKQIEGVK